jgi:3-hydroxybutyrate dehydrogenase
MAYTAAKHGLVGLTRSLALATGRYGITVNCLCPGYTETSTVDWRVVGIRLVLTQQRLNGGSKLR